MKHLTLTLQEPEYAICRLDPSADMPQVFSGFYSVTSTPDEFSIICEKDQAPVGAKVESEWRMFKVEGPLDFSDVGVMANLSSLLAEGGVSLMAISTYETDYLLVKEENLSKAKKLLSKSHEVR